MEREEFLTKFGKEIKKLRIDKDVSQESLAEKADIHVTFLSRIENGKANVSLITVLRLSEALDVKIVDLFNF